MIDIHSHILPNMDDGASSWGISLKMCQQAYEDGIKTIVATPHTLNGIYDNNPKSIEEKVKILNQKLKENNISLQVLPGSEVHLSADIIEKIKKQKILTLNKTNYILLEFPHTQVPLHIEEILFQIQIMGITPIFSHVERNLEFQRKPYLLANLIQKGALAQLTAASLCGGFGSNTRKFAQKLLANDLIYCIASDAHSDSKSGRNPILSKEVAEASKIIGQNAALDLVQTNPQKIIMNQGTIIS
ncbi:MAG TPA: tyrosine protein phosphatase [Candidatus Atribacteria bacterium]|nr:tyrosine protein phosphatase [Candidatus Atribacteria bacterium]